MSVDFKILQTSFNAVKEELENIDACLDYNYDDFNEEQHEQIKEMYELIKSVLKRISFTLYADSIFISSKE